MKSGKVIINGKIYSVNVALTEEEQSKGLMYKKAPVENMAFLYSLAKVNYFWMKNTIAPLDIVFCMNNKIIDIKRGEPLSLESIGPNTETDLVLEFNVNFTDRERIKIGDDVFLML
jgi:uncharacterized membrane protein (UPF0127 family)